jgi:D-glucosaminate-6-phosphate ammonia-lyase
MLNRTGRWNRRQWLASSGIAAAAGLELGRPAEAAPLALTSKLYESLGVRPFINARGTFTILTGSQSLPEVKEAMVEASRHFVHLDELMDAVGARIAELTKAEWGIVTAGCAAAISHATAACIAGTDPEKMQRLPNLTGLKSEVVMPRYARNVYDHAARMTGAHIVNVDTEEQLKAALGPKAAMVLIMSCPAAEQGPLSIENTSRIARAAKVPVLVDAAAEELMVPNIHLAHGATMVAYSGGKCLRGPQAAGLLLGPKDLLQAAWLNSAPHHAFGRSMKGGKEEIIGMLAALEAWFRRDHAAEWREWNSWLAAIQEQVCRVPGVSATVIQPEDLSNHAPQLRLTWDSTKLGITGAEAKAVLENGTPRIMLAGGSGDRRGNTESSLEIMPYMMNPGEHKIVAQAVYAVLSHPPKIDVPAVPGGEPSRVAGTWQVLLTFSLGQAAHQFTLQQDGGKLSGRHHTEMLEDDLRGRVDGNQVEFRSAHPYEGTVLEYAFSGTVQGETMNGTVHLGEYGNAHWEARRVAQS